MLNPDRSNQDEVLKGPTCTRVPAQGRELQRVHTPAPAMSARCCIIVGQRKVSVEAACRRCWQIAVGSQRPIQGQVAMNMTPCGHTKSTRTTNDHCASSDGARPPSIGTRRPSKRQLIHPLCQAFASEWWSSFSSMCNATCARSTGQTVSAFKSRSLMHPPAFWGIVRAIRALPQPVQPLEAHCGYSMGCSLRCIRRPLRLRAPAKGIIYRIDRAA